MYKHTPIAMSSHQDTSSLWISWISVDWLDVMGCWHQILNIEYPHWICWWLHDIDVITSIEATNQLTNWNPGHPSWLMLEKDQLFRPHGIVRCLGTDLVCWPLATEFHTDTNLWLWNKCCSCWLLVIHHALFGLMMFDAAPQIWFRFVWQTN